MARERKRRGLGLFVGAIIVLALLWLGYWFAANYAAERAIARANAGPIGNRKIDCIEPTVSGFPLRVDVRCTRATFAEDGDRVTAAVGGIAATAPLYFPGTVEAELNAPFVINAPALGLALTANWTLGSATASAGLGGLTGAGASFTSLAAENASTLSTVPVKSLTADRATGSLASEGGGAYTVMASATKLNLVRDDGGAYPPIDASARVLAEGVGDLGTDPRRAIIEWLRRGGSAKIERLRLAMGDVVIAANGTLTLSPEGLLSGSILLRYNSIEALGTLMETLRPGSREKYDLALQGLNAMSVPVESEDGAMRQTTVTLTDGVVWLAVIPLPIAPIPPLKL